ncbi:L-aspartate oxidase [Plectonema radiosum NIES-515]|uniref:L-aspartate oxidase n=1 Tax=Plectonema radiosum NIES-515 TaxID=2986073 RepID=A0ABT3AXN2_9CYAN|nr:L-aspartate oxidase [Plectonema radiosum]MCV3213760.1 L-aspartate oxidase [Plectonema radiosum NIES-515]
MSSDIVPAEFDILVVGSGAAGLYATLCIPTHFRVGLVTKDALNSGSSNWAQGGIAAAINPQDSPQLHFEDTLKAGAGLCDAEAVQFLVENARAAIQSLIETGVAFDLHGDKLATTLEAAHSHPRVLHSADTTGKEIVDILTTKVLLSPNIQVLSQALAISLWLHPETGHCQGISLLYQGEICWIRAGAVVLATGGGGQVFSQTTNPAVSTGDGVAIAWRSGALLRDLEFFQFHPTALKKPGAPRFLISEAVRGEGAHLVDGSGDRFAFNYHREGELAPRDVVSRAIFSHLDKTTTNLADAHVYLDLRTIPPAQIRQRFPQIIKVCQQWGIDVFQQPIPVAPAAHYWMGGIAVDLSSQSSIPGLYVIGEAASTGVHGANRLASNSLLECIVFAAQLSQIKPQIQIEPILIAEKTIPTSLIESLWVAEFEQIAAIREALPNLMWQSAGVYRQGEVIEAAIAQVSAWHDELASLNVSQYLFNLSPTQVIKLETRDADQQLRTTIETLNLLDIANLILKSSAFRTESRGGHYRIDYPDTESSWQVHTLVQGKRQWTSLINGMAPSIR